MGIGGFLGSDCLGGGGKETFLIGTSNDEIELIY